jgi:ParB family chromosome partitioning protein
MLYNQKLLFKIAQYLINIIMFHMKQQEKKLGRGLSALLGEKKSILEISDSDSTIENIEIEKIIPGIYQPRQNFDIENIKELSESIKINGILQPIILRKANDDKYEIIAGERRFRAVKIAGLSSIPAIIRKVNNHSALEMALIENIQREDLSIKEEAIGYKRLMDEFSYTQEDVARKVGKSRSHIANIIRLLNLPESVLKHLDNQNLSMGHARAIINSQDPEKLAEMIVTNNLTVRHAEDMVRNERDKNDMNYDHFKQNKETFNSEYWNDFEKEFFRQTKMSAQIFINPKTGAGNMNIKFDDIRKLENMMFCLKNNKFNN